MYHGTQYCATCQKCHKQVGPGHPRTGLRFSMQFGMPGTAFVDGSVSHSLCICKDKQTGCSHPGSRAEQRIRSCICCTMLLHINKATLAQDALTCPAQVVGMQGKAYQEQLQPAKKQRQPVVKSERCWRKKIRMESWSIP